MICSIIIIVPVNKMQEEVKAISLASQESIHQLLEFSKSISQRCFNFTEHFLQLVKDDKPYDKIQIRQEYLTLLKKHFKYEKTITPQPLCAKILNNGQFAFKCFQCQNENNSIICIQCFNKSDHKGHMYQKIPVAGGCCDCGDDQKWKTQGSCTDHNKKQFNIQLDKNLTTIFINQMKYVVYLVFVLNFSLFIKFYKIHQVGLLESLATFLIQFNQQSMISNQMTFQLFKSEYTSQYPQVILEKKKFYIKLNLFSVLSRFYKQKQFSRMMIDLFIIMFTRIQFKKYLTTQYNKLVSSRPDVIMSQYSNISCQIYTSHKVIEQLMQKHLFPPIVLANFPQNTKFEHIADSYARFYIDLTYLAGLYNNTGEKYIFYHFDNSNVVELTGYEKYVRHDVQDSVQYYGIEFIFFHNRAGQFFKPLRKSKKILLKTIRDTINYLASVFDQQTFSLYISKQRTLCLLLMIYFDGDIVKAVQKSFLDQLGLSYQLLFRILQAVLNVIRFYAVNLSNRQTVERYYTFYSFSLSRKSRTVVSLDFQLVKFCLLSLQLYSPAQIDLQFDLQKNLSYELSISFLQNNMPLQNLISLPIKFVQNLNKNVVDNEEGAYDRKKALNFLTDYIGLLNEIITTNHAELNIKNIYLQNNQKQIMKFYGDLLKSIKTIKPELFKQICKILIGDQNPYFMKFIKQYCVLQYKTLKLNPTKQDNFQFINLSYLKCLKTCDLVTLIMEQKFKKNSLQFYPKRQSQQSYRNDLKYIIFNPTTINDLVGATKNYLQILQKQPKILTKDIATFEQFIQQLIKLNYTIKNSKIELLLRQIHQCSQIFKYFDQKLRTQMLKCLGSVKIANLNQESSNKRTQQQKKKMQQLKIKKLQKLKSRQLKALNSHTESLNLINQSDKKMQQKSQYIPQCMYCKHSAQNQPLSVLSFTQKSNLLTKNIMRIDRSVGLITSCNHFVHLSCNKSINNQRKYIYCVFCKTSSNLLVQVNEQKQEQKGKLIKIKSMQLQSEQSQQLNFLKRIKKFKSTMFSQQNQESSEQQKYEENPDKVSNQQRKIECIAYAILYGVIVDYNFFVKSLSSVCCFVLRELALQTSVIKIQNLLNELQQCTEGIELNQDQSAYWDAYKFSILSVSSLLIVERTTPRKNWDIRTLQQKLPINLVNNIMTLLASIKSIQSLKILQQTKIQPICPLMLRKLPEHLSQLAKDIGQCPNCSRITNEIALCMLCDFKSCVSCQASNLANHVKNHGEASIFIRVDEGLIIYVSQLKNRYHIPLYRNFMGEYFVLDKNKQDRSDYTLDISQYNKIRNDLIRHRVQQHIRYEQLTTNRYSTIHP